MLVVGGVGTLALLVWAIHWAVKVGGDPQPGLALKDDVLDGIPLAAQRASDAWIERRARCGLAKRGTQGGELGHPELFPFRKAGDILPLSVASQVGLSQTLLDVCQSE
jgi:hypothetical protein